MGRITVPAAHCSGAKERINCGRDYTTQPCLLRNGGISKDLCKVEAQNLKRKTVCEISRKGMLSVLLISNLAVNTCFLPMIAWLTLAPLQNTNMPWAKTMNHKILSLSFNKTKEGTQNRVISDKCLYQQSVTMTEHLFIQ